MKFVINNTKTEVMSHNNICIVRDDLFISIVGLRWGAYRKLKGDVVVSIE